MNRLFVVVLIAMGCADADSDGKRGGKDCDDSNAAVFEGAEEVCDGIDNDCDGQIDEDVAIVAYLDRDGDGFGDEAFVRRVCVLPDDGALQAGDCDDSAVAIHPDAEEICDEIDNDCNGAVDDGVTLDFYVDADGDGYGTGAPVGTSAGCWPDPGFAVNGADCDDNAGAVHPDADEICDDLDNDCDGSADEGLPLVQVFADADGDGGGDPSDWSVACGPGAGSVLDDRDCDDTDPDIGPFAPEIAGNAVDEDCDGYLDELAVPDGYATVEDALADAVDGSVIQFGDGTHFVNLDLTGHDVTLAGNGCGHTVLYGAQSGSVVQMDVGTLVGLTLTGGSGTVWDPARPGEGGGLFVPAGEVVVREACFEDNSVGGRGGAIAALEGSLVTVEHSVFERNIAVGAGGAIYGDRAEFLVGGSRFYSNTSTNGTGGAIAVAGGHLDASNTVYAWNRSRLGGSAITLDPYQDTPMDPAVLIPTTAVLSHLTVHGGTNSSASRPSALLVRGAVADLTASIFSDNEGQWVIYMTSSAVDINDHQLVPTMLQLDNGFIGNAGRDQKNIAWELGAVREPAAFVSVDPARPDFRLRVASGYRDRLDTLDPDGTAGDLGAFGGPSAPLGSFAPLADVDSDGLNDGWELQHGLPIFVENATEDPDGDGLDNLGEALLDSNPHLSDSDDDGVEDLTEQLAGSDPTDPRDQVPVADGGTVHFALVGTVALVSSAESFDPNGYPLTTSWSLNTPGGSALTQVDDPAAIDATFTPDVAGTYTLTLTVDNGLRAAVHITELQALPGVNVPSDYPTLQEAIDGVAVGEAISIDPGVWDASVVLLNQGILLFGTGPGVVLQGNGDDSVLRVGGGQILLADLTLQGGGRGALVVDDSANFEGHRLVFQDSTNFAGGGVNIASTPTQLYDSVFRGNEAVVLGGGLYASDSLLELTGCHFDSNRAGDQGSALYLLVISGSPGDPICRDCLFTGNTAPGAVVYLDGTSIDAEFEGTAFVANRGDTAVFLERATLDAHSVVSQDNVFSLAIVTGTSWATWLRAAQSSDSVPLVGFDEWDQETPRGIADLQPALHVRDGLPNDTWRPRLGSSAIDRGWADRSDPDGSRFDAGLSSRHPADSRWSLDTDHDGMSDGWEVWAGTQLHVDDRLDDLDFDGLDNGAEHAAGTHPLDPDTDGDGETDGAELAAAQDPLDPFDNQPIALTGGPYYSDLGDLVTLDGSTSLDPNGDPLTYSWAFTDTPAGSTLTSAALDTTPTPAFTPDVRGLYGISLVVNDGNTSSELAQTTLEVAGELRVPDDFVSIEAAAAIAVTHDVIQVGPGSWPTRITRSDIDYTIAGAGANTVLEGIDGLTAFTLLDGGTLTLTDLAVAHSTGSLGGAVRCENSGLTTQRVLFRDNLAQKGGALYLDGCSTVLVDSLLFDNQAITEGGALHSVGATALQVTRTLVLRNTAGTKGGGFFLHGDTLATLRATQLLFNEAGVTGGALYRFGTGSVTADHVTVAGNVAINGGGFYFNATPMRITNSIFSANTEHQVEELGVSGARVNDTSLWRPDFPFFAANPVSLQTQAGVVLLNPQFVQFNRFDSTEFDTHLRPDSPLIGKATDLNPDGSPGDLGAYGGPDAPPDWDYWNLDADGDGLPDNWEVLYGTDPATSDALLDLDGDGLANIDEYSIGTRPDLADTDGDGVDDNTEVGSGTNPSAPQDNRPIAVGGLDVEVDPGTLVTLDGSGSSDPNNDGLTYSWAVTLAPATTALTPANLAGSSTDTMSFTPDVAGSFRVELTVHDGAAPSLPDVVVVVVRGDLTVPGHYSSPALAVAAIADGYLVTVDAGVYPGPIDPTGKNVIVQGAGAGATVLDGVESGSVISAIAGETLTLRDLTITGGFATEGAGVLARGGSTVVLERVHVEANRGTRGAGVFAQDATVTALSSRIVDNDAAASGGGVHLEPDGVFMASQLLLAGNGAWDGDGGGIASNRGLVTLDNVVVADNTARFDGGGLFSTGTSSVGPQLIVDFATLVHNDAERGGGIWFEYGDIDLKHLLVVDNRQYGLAYGTGSASPDTHETAFTWTWQNAPNALSGITLDAAWPGNVSASNPGLTLSDDADWTNDDWLLGPAAQAIDAGDPAVLDSDGSPADVGAFGGPDGVWIP